MTNILPALSEALEAAQAGEDAEASLEADLLSMRLHVLETMFPAEASERNLLHADAARWTLPSEDVAGFASDLTAGAIRPWAYTTRHLLAAKELRTVGFADEGTVSSSRSVTSSSSSQEAEQDVPRTPTAAATFFTAGALDALWAAHHASGDSACIDRVVTAAGTGLAAAGRQRGARALGRYMQALGAPDKTAADAVKALRPEAPEDAMELTVGFGAARSLLTNCRRDTQVWDYLLTRYEHNNNGKNAAQAGEESAEDKAAYAEVVKMLSVFQAAEDLAAETTPFG